METKRCCCAEEILEEDVRMQSVTMYSVQVTTNMKVNVSTFHRITFY